MTNRIGAQAAAPPNRPTDSESLQFPLFFFLILILAGGCAAPAEPIERKTPVLEAVTDLAATQSGDEVLLTFTLPRQTVDRRPLKQVPSIEIYRLIRPAMVGATAGPGSQTSLTLLATIPSAMVDQYVERGHIRYEDSLKVEDFPASGEASAEYTVRTRVSPKKESADSNPATLNIYPPPEPVSDLKGEMTHAGLALTWTAPQKNLLSQPVTIAKYHIYRAELTPGETSEMNAAKNPGMKAPAVQIGESSSTTYRDMQTQTGTTNTYSVRSVVQHGAEMLESANSNWAVVTTKPAVPPAAPQGLVVVFVPAIGEAPAHVELSWAINPETDIAGYYVYRSEQEQTSGTRLNPELLLTPAFRDMNAVPGRRYLYTVTAVDRSGNESQASAAVAGGVPNEHGPTP